MGKDQNEAVVLHQGKGARVTIELRNRTDGKQEAFLVPSGAPPIATGVFLTEKNGKYLVPCRIRKKPLQFKPEEIIRQRELNRLIDELGYPESRIKVEVPIQMGSTVHDKPADIVVYTDATLSSAWIIVETKEPNRKTGIEQLKSYMNPTGATFGLWANGLDQKPLLRSGANDYSRPILRIPRDGETLSDIDEPLTRDKLEPISDLYGVLKDMEQSIIAHQTIDTFEEIFKVVFAKLFDERVNLKNDKSVAKFRLGLTEDPAKAANAVRQLFESAKTKWVDVYDSSDKIELNDTNLTYCIKTLQGYHLIKSGDVLGVAFETLVNEKMKGKMGQYFTPRQVVNMMVTMMNPTIEERVCDPACGSGGFLIYAMRAVNDYIANTWDDPDDRAEQRKDYAQEKLVGMDSDGRLVKVAKAYMIMENDGRSGLAAIDSLDYAAWDKTQRERILKRKMKAAELDAGVLTTDRQPKDGLDLILTNPPFAGEIDVTSTLKQYDLARNEKGKPKESVIRAILFLERCLDMLRPGGRMAIVLPQGLLNNISDQRVREFIDQKARVLAVVGLHPFTFKPFTLAKTSVLFLQKWEEGEHLEDYPIFTAISTRPGKTKLGNPQYLADGKTLDTDMDDIAAEFLKWAKKQGFAFAEAK